MVATALRICRRAPGARPPDPTDPLAGPKPWVTGKDLLQLGLPAEGLKGWLTTLYEEQWAGLLRDRAGALARATQLSRQGPPPKRGMEGSDRA
jgi:hypothetical protein